ncbi:hypothetical protein JHK87_048781 [Glycine soja]|nr:hypothetical protein JHK87_048781 [Glycine soja]
MDLVFSHQAVWFRRFSTDSATTLGFFKWAKSQTGYRHSPELYYLMVDVLGKCKSFDSMSELVEEMARLEGYVTLETMTKVMRRLARTRKHEDAIQAFRRMEKFGVKKDTTTLNVLIDALVKGDSVEHAHKVVLEFKGSIPLSSRSFKVLTHGWCRARNFDNSDGCVADTPIYSSMIFILGKPGRLKDACDVFDDMSKQGFVRDIWD